MTDNISKSRKLTYLVNDFNMLTRLTVKEKQEHLDKIKTKIQGKSFLPFQTSKSLINIVRFTLLPAPGYCNVDEVCHCTVTQNWKNKLRWIVSINIGGDRIKLMYRRAKLDRVKRDVIEFIEQAGGKVLGESVLVMA